MSENKASRREFLLYWVGLFVAAFSVVSIFVSISNLVGNVLSYNCYIPVVSGMLGVPPPPVTNAITITATTVTNRTMPINGTNQQLPPYEYCANPIILVSILSFVFNLLSAFVFIGVGVYMMLNGKKR